MLTETQLRTAKTAELELLQARIQEELDSRVQPDLQRLKQDQKTAKNQLFYSGQPGQGPPCQPFSIGGKRGGEAK